MKTWLVRPASWQQDQKALRTIRQIVFIEEQNVPFELEWDEWDEKAWHLLALTTDKNPIGVARVLPTGQIGRMAVLQAWRRHGVGSELLQQALDLTKVHHLEYVFVHAQITAKSFYRSFGFQPVGKTFSEAGISHIRMVLKKSG